MKIDASAPSRPPHVGCASWSRSPLGSTRHRTAMAFLLRTLPPIYRFPTSRSTKSSRRHEMFVRYLVRVLVSLRLPRRWYASTNHGDAAPFAAHHCGPRFVESSVPSRPPPPRVPKHVALGRSARASRDRRAAKPPVSWCVSSPPALPPARRPPGRRSAGAASAAALLCGVACLMVRLQPAGFVLSRLACKLCPTHQAGFRASR